MQFKVLKNFWQINVRGQKYLVSVIVGKIMIVEIVMQL